MNAGTMWTIMKRGGQDFLADRAMAWAAAIAFYTALSFAPIILLLISIGDWLGSDDRNALLMQIEQLMGQQASGAVAAVVENANQQQGQGVVAFIISLGVTLFSASGVFGQLQTALNQIWEIKPAPGNGLMQWVRKRLLSMGMVLALAFMLLVSLAASTMLGYVVPQWESLGRVTSVLVSLVVITPLFMLMFKVLPDAVVAWRDVVFGAVLTSALFVVGRALIGLYLGHAAVGSAYGAAGSLIVMLVWVYYSAIIVLFGAELTQARAQLSGRRLEPDEHAVKDPSVAVRRDPSMAV